MHELSIASSILELAQQHVPRGSILRSVRVIAGPLRGIEPEALDFAWRATIAGTPADGASMQLHVPPWTLHCPRCNTTFTGAESFSPCPCGNTACQPVASDQLTISSIEVDP